MDEKIRKSTKLTGSVENNTRVFAKWRELTLKAKTIPAFCFTVDSAGNLEILTEITEQEVMYIMEKMFQALKQRKPLIVTNRMP